MSQSVLAGDIIWGDEICRHDAPRDPKILISSIPLFIPLCKYGNHFRATITLTQFSTINLSTLFKHSPAVPQKSQSYDSLAFQNTCYILHVCDILWHLKSKQFVKDLKSETLCSSEVPTLYRPPWFSHTHLCLLSLKNGAFRFIFHELPIFWKQLWMISVLMSLVFAASNQSMMCGWVSLMSSLLEKNFLAMTWLRFVWADSFPWFTQC